MISKIKLTIAMMLVCMLFVAAKPLSAQADPKSTPYVIQPNDVLDIFVWKQPELSKKVTVQPGGRISIPLVQDITAAGYTPEQLKEAIEKRLKDQALIDTPNVTVSIDAIQSYRIYVNGKVAKSGILVSEKPISMLMALAMAGPFQEYAKKQEITIFRGNGAQATILKFNYDEVIKGLKQDQNIMLQAGDIINVP